MDICNMAIFNSFFVFSFYGIDNALVIVFYLFSPFSWKSRFRLNDPGFSYLVNNK